MIAETEKLTRDQLDRADFAAALDGDDVAFARIVKRNEYAMRQTAYRLVHSNEDAEEVTMQAFANAYRHLHRFRNDSSVLTWLIRITLNLARNRWHYHRRRQQRAHLSLQSPIEDTDTVSLADVIADERDGADLVAGVELTEHESAIGDAIQTLAPKHRLILELRAHVGMEYEELAAHLGINVGTVKSRLARAREALREVLEARTPGALKHLRRAARV